MSLGDLKVLKPRVPGDLESWSNNSDTLAHFRTSSFTPLFSIPGYVNLLSAMHFWITRYRVAIIGSYVIHGV